MTGLLKQRFCFGLRQSLFFERFHVRRLSALNLLLITPPQHLQGLVSPYIFHAAYLAAEGYADATVKHQQAEGGQDHCRKQARWQGHSQSDDAIG